MAKPSGSIAALQLGLLLACAHSTALAQEQVFVYGTPGGCLVQLTQAVMPQESLRWEGACKDEFAQGQGTLTVLSAPATVVSATRGLMERGVPQGTWTKVELAAPAEGPVAPPGEVVASAPAGPAPAAPPAVTTTPAPGFDSRIGFGLASAKLTREAQQQLRAAAVQLNGADFAKSAVKVIGHADASGSPAANAKLAQLRARTVRDFLVAQQVAASRLTVEGRAATELVMPDEPTASANRRVTFELVAP